MQEAASASGSPIVTIVALGALTILPFVFMTTTSFVKISVVFSILRNALGTGQIPSGTVITALSAILTLYVMAPVGVEIAAATAPAVERIDRQDPLSTTDAVFEAVELGLEPLRDFLVRNTGPRERAMFFELARESRPADQRDAVGDRDLLVIAPAFMVTELSEAFQIGFLVFIPFLVVDLVIASMLISLGMIMLPPVMIALPFKLMLFVLVDGWNLTLTSLVSGLQ